MTKEEIDRHEKRIIHKAEAKIYLMPLPIVSENITEICSIQTKKGFIRLYPPFPINEKSEASAAFSEIGIPTGNRTVSEKQFISESTVTGLVAEHDYKNATWCRGFRIDAGKEINCQVILNILIEQIAQYTY